MPVKLFDFLQSRMMKRLRNAYPDSLALFEGLKREEADAIRYLALRVSGSVIRAARTYQLSDEDAEELLGDCITLMIGHIREGRYTFAGNDPATYVVEIARNRVRSVFRASRKRQYEDLEAASGKGEAPEAGTWADKELLDLLLNRLDEGCRTLIRLSYLEGWKDKEILEQKRVPQTTIEALKMHRVRCMRKLAALAKGLDSN